MNHRITSCQCNDCNEKFTYETKGIKNIWFVGKNDKVLLGTPRCFEHYVYTCKHCGGDVHYRNLSSNTHKLADGTEYTIVKAGEPQVYQFECMNCHEKVVSSNHYYHEG